MVEVQKENVEVSNWYTSSSGNGLSATVGGLSLVGLAPALVLVLGLAGVKVDQVDLVQTLSTVTMAAGSAYAAFGALRKAYFSVCRLLGK